MKLPAVLLWSALLTATSLGLTACKDEATANTSEVPAVQLVESDSANAAKTPSTGEAATAISVENARIRVTSEGQTVTGAFMVLKNDSDKPQSLVAAESEVAGVTELHESSMQDGVMKMQKIEKIAIPAHGSTELKPGGFHIMLINLKDDLAADSTQTITLKFADGSEKAVEAPVMDMMQ
ncbi:copper chaperone PCu(A)C [Thiolinea disciformis]|uniref:copper chaperone PCu(A)C n=1 Tax=Thiolinea disciformis TaxID=125614 RepID=UPI000374E2BF|nr:copper chaperone PCu(A)C [Thiolinea disciformis]